MENKLLPIPIEFKVSRNDWFTFLTIRKEYDKLIEQWKQYFYIQMINKFSNYEYQNGWAFHPMPIGFRKYFKKLKFTWYVKEYKDAWIGFQCIINDDFYFGMTPLLKLRDLYNTDGFETLHHIFQNDYPYFFLSPLTGINDPELLLWEMGNNSELLVKIGNNVQLITESLEITELFIALNKAKLELKE